LVKPLFWESSQPLKTKRVKSLWLRRRLSPGGIESVESSLPRDGVVVYEDVIKDPVKNSNCRNQICKKKAYRW
jgi:hypothetical protein